MAGFIKLINPRILLYEHVVNCDSIKARKMLVIHNLNIYVACTKFAGSMCNYFNKYCYYLHKIDYICATFYLGAHKARYVYEVRNTTNM